MNMPATPAKPWAPMSIARFAVNVFQHFPDTFFAKRYGPLAVVLETVVAVAGRVSVAAHRMESDYGWIRVLILLVQGAFFNLSGRVDDGTCANVPAPQIAIDYWQLAPDARLPANWPATRPEDNMNIAKHD